MFNLGLPELILLGLAALLLWGPTRLPALARALGRSIHDFKKHLEEGRGERNGSDAAKTVESLPPPRNDA